MTLETAASPSSTTSFLVMTFLGPDRPGLVRTIAAELADCGANWLDSRMARLAGQFCGIVRLEFPTSRADAVLAAIDQLKISGISIKAVHEVAHPEPDRQLVKFDVVGNDRPGIVLELTSAIAGARGNVEELTTGLESAPMSGHGIFHARGQVSIEIGLDPALLTAAIEKLGGDLSVVIS